MTMRILPPMEGPAALALQTGLTQGLPVHRGADMVRLCRRAASKASFGSGATPLNL